MSSPPIPESDAAPSPHFADANACKRWLKALPLTNIGLAHAAFITQLEQLNRSAIAPLERLKINELLREPVAFVQQAQARKYLGKPLPLEVHQLDIWNSIIRLWAAMGASYRLSLQSALEGDPNVAGHIALCTHRCLHYTGLQMLEHYRTYRETGKDLWRQAHELYALAEQQDYASRPVKDSLNKESQSTTCSAAYAQILLTDLADPYRLSSRQLSLLERWLDKWAIRVTLSATPPEDASLSVLGVDLGGAAGPVPAPQGKAMVKLRYLDMERLAITFRKRIKQLRKGDAPAALGLGEDCVQPECEDLLTILYHQWFEAAWKKRNFSRRPGVNKVRIALGMAEIHFFLSGEKPFRQPGEKEKLSKREIEDLQFFGRISEQTEKSRLSQLGFTYETWQIQDESALGLRLVRPDEEGMRVTLKQLVAVRPDDSNTYALGVIKWLSFPPNDGLHAGIRILPCVPLPVAARPLSLMADAANKFVPAFLLPDMPVLHEAASLILPPGWFAPGKQVEIHSGELLTVRLHSLIEKGSDFERVGFVRI
ncbi:MAG: hypothetical protein M1547_12510 [Gammaproteobacteria bacterium]|nr:hypothetical protein [Gammaproteobacteria bacterium]